jgi:hypothetical protein
LSSSNAKAIRLRPVRGECGSRFAADRPGLFQTSRPLDASVSYSRVMNKANVTATTAPSTGIPTRKATSRRHSGSRTRKNFGRPRSTTTALSATSSSSLTKPQPILPALVGETPCRSRAGLGVVTLGYGVVPVVLRGAPLVVEHTCVLAHYRLIRATAS